MTATGMTQGQRLAADAAAATEVRNYQTDPDVVALRVERVRALGDRLIWASIGILLVFAVVTVQRFVARDATIWSLEWVGAWFLEPGVICGLIGILIWESMLTRWDEPVGPWTRGAKRGLLAATYLMNTWHAWFALDLYGILAHSVPPIGVFCLVEARVECLTALERCARKAYEAAERKQAKQRGLAELRTAPLAPPVAPARLAPIGPPVPPSLSSPLAARAARADRVPVPEPAAQPAPVPPVLEPVVPFEPPVATRRVAPPPEPPVSASEADPLQGLRPEALTVLNVEQLRELARRAGLTVRGNRTQLLDRLTEHLSGNGHLTAIGGDR